MVRNRRRVREFTVDNMEIKITTYTDNEKVYEDKHFGEFSEEISSEKIVYNDKNEKKIKIFIDKIKEKKYTLHIKKFYQFLLNKV